MPRSSPIQTSFSGGELSPRLRGRVDIDLYRRALATCRDAQPTAHGSILRRPGTKWIAELPNDESVRLIPLRLKDGQDVILVLTDGEMRVYSVQGGELVTDPGSVAEMILNGDFASGLAEWTTMYGSPTIESGGVEFGPDWHSPAAIQQDFTLATAQTVLVQVDVAHAGWLRMGILKGPAFTDHKWSTSAGTMAIGHYQWSVYLPAGTYRYWVGGYNDAIVDNVSITYDTGGGGGDGYALDTPWTSEHLSALQWVAESAGDRLYVVHPDVAPYYIQKSASGWTVNVLTITDQPDEWVAGNYPAAVEMYQNRVWFAGTRLQPNTIWGSRTGTPNDFTVHDPVVATDAIIAPISTKGAIRWLLGRSMLLVGTDLGEYSLVASGGVLKPSDLQARDESDFGSAAIIPTRLGNQVVYVSADRRKVRGMGYVQEPDAWRSADVSFIGEHLTEPLIAEVHRIRDPDGGFAVVLDDGTLALCAADEEHQVTAWWGATLTDGEVLSAAVAHGPDGSVLFMAVQRGADIGLEAMAFAEAHPDRMYVDAGRAIDITDVVLVDDAAQVGGFDHLEGETVEVIIDDEYQGQQVVAGGEVTIGRTGETLVAGLPYSGSVVTLNPEGGNPGGTAQGASKRWSRITLRLQESALPLVNGERPPERDAATAMDTAEPLFTGDVHVFASSWKDHGQITITMDLPLRTEVLAILGRQQVNE